MPPWRFGDPILLAALLDRLVRHTEQLRNIRRRHFPDQLLQHLRRDVELLADLGDARSRAVFPVAIRRRRRKRLSAALARQRHRHGRLAQGLRSQLRRPYQRQVLRPDVGPVAVQEQRLLAGAEPAAEVDGQHVPLERDTAVLPTRGWPDQ